ncbi:MAG: winged helix-turn-helix domain-containing protein [Acidobacteria bacterium]|nr:winged helix-turn-helix domain-containing protein [Acidobacteriota bacterium]
MRRLPAELPSLTSNGGHARKVVRFGVFELDLRTGELRKQGVKLKLQGKPLQVLQALVESPGQLVTREELRRRLWPSDVFVDFDSGLNTAANRLRITLGDSAENPRYIETLARAGYRFIAPIAVVDASSPPTDAPRPRRRRVVLAATAAALLVVVLAAWLLVGRPPSDGFQFRQVTFRRGQIWGARFAPDGHAILYTANWDNGPRHLFLTNPSSPESRSLGFDDLRLVSVSRSGELAMLSIDGTVPIAGGTLHRVPLNGGAPKHVEHHVMSADWSPDGALAIAHAIDGVNQLEFPVGTVLQKTAGWISSIRISPDRDRVAFIEHPLRNENQGSVKLAEAGRPLRTLSADWANAGGIAWHPSGREIWFTASRDGAPKSLWAVTLSGKLRSVAQIAGTMTLCDIASDGRALTSRETRLLEMAAIVEGEATQRDLSWLDWSRVADVSADGRLVLFDEGGVAAGSQFLTYVHRLDDQSTVRLGEGRAMALSSDGRFALTLDSRERTRLRLLPLGDGKAAELPPSGLEYQWARYFPDGRRLLALANEPGRPLRLYVQPPTGKPFPITPPTVVRNAAVSPDGTEVAFLSADGKLVVSPAIEGGAGRILPTPAPLAPLLWARDDRLYVQQLGAYTQIPTRIARFDLSTGHLEPWRDVTPVDSLGVNAITKVMLSEDTRTVVFNYRRVLSELFVAEPAAR